MAAVATAAEEAVAIAAPVVVAIAESEVEVVANHLVDPVVQQEVGAVEATAPVAAGVHLALEKPPAHHFPVGLERRPVVSLVQLQHSPLGAVVAASAGYSGTWKSHRGTVGIAEELEAVATADTEAVESCPLAADTCYPLEEGGYHYYTGHHLHIPALADTADTDPVE